MFTRRNWAGKLVQTEKPRLEFGYDAAVPSTTKAAWGARTIVTRGRYPDLSPLSQMDLLHDRQNFCWTDESEKERLKKLLNDGILEEMQKKYAELRKNGEIQDNKANTVVLYESDQVKAVGNTNASYGYLYVAAWLIHEVDK